MKQTTQDMVMTLPTGWEIRYDTGINRKFYVNHNTQETLREHPATLPTQQPHSPTASALSVYTRLDFSYADPDVRKVSCLAHMPLHKFPAILQFCQLPPEQGIQNTQLAVHTRTELEHVAFTSYINCLSQENIPLNDTSTRHFHFKQLTGDEKITSIYCALVPEHTLELVVEEDGTEIPLSKRLKKQQVKLRTKAGYATDSAITRYGVRVMDIAVASAHNASVLAATFVVAEPHLAAVLMAFYGCGPRGYGLKMQAKAETEMTPMTKGRPGVAKAGHKGGVPTWPCPNCGTALSAGRDKNKCGTCYKPQRLPKVCPGCNDQYDTKFCHKCAIAKYDPGKRLTKKENKIVSAVLVAERQANGGEPARKKPKTEPPNEPQAPQPNAPHDSFYTQTAD